MVGSDVFAIEIVPFWGTFVSFPEDWDTLGKIREITTAPWTESWTVSESPDFFFKSLYST